MMQLVHGGDWAGYRAQYGPFAQVEDAAQVPGITQAMVDSWAGQAYVR